MNNLYYNKYLKYKIKYINLIKNLNNNKYSSESKSESGSGGGGENNIKVAYHPNISSYSLLKINILKNTKMDTKKCIINNKEEIYVPENKIDILVEESKKYLNIELKIPNICTKYMNYYFNLQKKHNIIINPSLWGANNPTKEITESCSAHKYVFTVLKEFCKIKTLKEWYCTNVLVLCVGDGNRPQTGTLFAITNCKWNIYSIDPIMDDKYQHSFPNLHCVSALIEDCSFDYSKYDLVIIVGVHSHANLNNLWNSIQAKKILVTLPCCGSFVHTLADVRPVIEEYDIGIISPKNKVFCYVN